MPTTDLDSHEPWRASQRRSRARRVAAAVALASLTLAAGGATAAERGGGDGSWDRGAKAVRQAGGSVAELQRALGIPADGIYGPQTRRAVRRFQRANGLTVDGIAGPQTLGALGLQARGSRRGGGSGRTARILDKIAQCESGGNPAAVSANGRYFGKYQFSRPTWRSVGGTGNPARASEAEQDRRARILFRRAGTSPWPHCGR